MQPKKCATRLVEIDGRLRPRSRYVATSSRGTQGTVLWCFAKRISLGPADLHPLKYHRYLSRGYRRQYRRRSDHLLAELRMETLNTPQRPAAAPPASHGPPGSPDRTAFQSIPISFASGARSSHQCTWNGATRMSFRLPVMTPGRWGEFPQSVMAIAAKARTATPPTRPAAFAFGPPESLPDGVGEPPLAATTCPPNTPSGTIVSSTFSAASR